MKDVLLLLSSLGACFPGEQEVESLLTLPDGRWEIGLGPA